MKPCPFCSKIIKAIAGIGTLKVGDDLKLQRICYVIEYCGPPEVIGRDNNGCESV
jgi:hypothetical protein